MVHRVNNYKGCDDVYWVAIILYFYAQTYLHKVMFRCVQSFVSLQICYHSFFFFHHINLLTAEWINNSTEIVKSPYYPQIKERVDTQTGTSICPECFRNFPVPLQLFWSKKVETLFIPCCKQWCSDGILSRKVSYKLIIINFHNNCTFLNICRILF